jgi:phosphoribosyl 1,2-cyclic phosphodiesterase
MRVHLCGVRGSTPAPGASFAGVGGHTSCVAVAHDDERAPRLVLDAGTGLRNVTALVGEEPFQGTLLLGHLHWDHTQGLPFFAAGDRDGSRVRVIVPEQGVEPEALLARMMSPPFFPIEPTGLRGRWSFGTIGHGRHEVEGFSVVSRWMPHPGGPALGFRVSDGHSSLAYVSDHGPLALGPGPDGWGPYHDAVLELVDGVDLLLHDAQYTAAELARRPHFGHSAVDYAVALAGRGGVGRLLLFHHDPSRTDDEVEGLVRDARAGAGPIPVAAAVEGDTIVL